MKFLPAVFKIIYLHTQVHTVAVHLRAAIGLRAAFGKILLHQNSSLCTVTFGDKVLTLAKSRGT